MNHLTLPITLLRAYDQQDRKSLLDLARTNQSHRFKLIKTRIKRCGGLAKPLSVNEQPEEFTLKVTLPDRVRLLALAELYEETGDVRYACVEIITNDEVSNHG